MAAWWQIVDRIVRGAHHLDVHLFHDAAGREVGLGQLVVALVPDGLCGLRPQQLARDAKGPLELEMGPVIEGLPMVWGTVRAQASNLA